MYDSYRLWSLWDMLKLPVAKLVGTFMVISDFGRVMHDGSVDRPDKNIAFPENSYNDLLNNISIFCACCEEMDLEVTMKCARDFESLVKQIARPDGSGVVDASDLALFASYANMVSGCLPREADTKHLFSVPSQRIKFLEPKEPLFGVAVNDQFPEAATDIEDAGRCLALGQGTATVMHLMRVMEVGLKAVAQGLKIPYAPSWESYLTQISKKIAEKHAKKTLGWKRQEKFYRDVSGDILSIKQAWRNPTMHVDRKYYPDEAQVIFESVKTLMQRLATRLSSKKKTG